MVDKIPENYKRCLWQADFSHIKLLDFTNKEAYDKAKDIQTHKEQEAWMPKERREIVVGKRIFLQRELPDAQVVQQYAQIPAANVCDVLQRSCAMHPRIRLMSAAEGRMVGTAYTVKTRAGDNLTIHAAMEHIGEGDVLVVSNEGDDSRALMGEIMFSYLRCQKKIAGIVLDGPLRDYDAVRGMDFPIYATGSTPGGPYKEGPGEVNVPIACGNVPVAPGDIILGDADGVVVIPHADAAAALEKCRAYHAADEAKLQAALSGTSDRSWVARKLQEKDYEVIDGRCGG